MTSTNRYAALLNRTVTYQGNARRQWRFLPGGEEFGPTGREVQPGERMTVRNVASAGHRGTVLTLVAPDGTRLHDVNVSQVSW